MQTKDHPLMKDLAEDLKKLMSWMDRISVKKLMRLNGHIDVLSAYEHSEDSNTSSLAQGELTLAGPTAPVTFNVIARKELYPRDVRELLWAIQAERAKASGGGADKPWFIVTEFLSPGAGELLVNNKIGFYVKPDSVHIQVQGLIVDIAKARTPVPRTFGSLFTASRAKILQFMLLNPSIWTSVKYMASLAEASPGTVSGLFKRLERLEWMQSRGKGPRKQRGLSNPKELLDEWRRLLPKTSPYPTRSYFVPSGRLPLERRVTQAFEDHKVKYAFTGAYAAQHYTSWLTQMPKMELYATDADDFAHSTEQVKKALQALGAQEVTEGSNLVVTEVPSPEHIFWARRIGGRSFANPVQVYLDLTRAPGRSEELAAHLRSEILRY